MIVKIDSGGTPHGISTVEEWVNGCQRKCLLREDADHSLATLTGTLVHALLRVYYTKGHFEIVKVKWKNFDLTHPLFLQAETRAFNVFREYRMRFSPIELGKVLHAELGFKIRNENVIGCVPFTGRIDLIVKLNKRDCNRLKVTRGIDLEPGIYIVDHKTGGGIYPNTLERLSLGLQPAAYMYAYEFTTKKKVKGFLVNFMTTTRDPKFHTIVIPRPGVLARERLFSVTRSREMDRWPKFELSRANVSRCFDYNSVCSHWVNARCTGV